MSNAHAAVGDAVAVVGAGAWGTTLAIMLAERSIPVVLVAHSDDHARQLAEQRENERYLPGQPIPRAVDVTHDAQVAARRASLILVVVPSQRVRPAALELRNSLRPDALVVSCAKGIEQDSLLRMTEVVADAAAIASERICALSGPNLAGEIAIGMPASTVVASVSDTAARTAQRLLGSPRFRVYTSSDVVGVEYGGALKNVIALAAGAVDGMGIGQNAKAALVARGLAEMTRIGVAAGANPLTFGGLSGLGDLIATCESPLSRNRTFGERLGRGVSPQFAAGDSPHVVEGVVTTEVVVRLADRYQIDVPIAAAVQAVLRQEISARDAVEQLMAREARQELDGDRIRA